MTSSSQIKCLWLYPKYYSLLNFFPAFSRSGLVQHIMGLHSKQMPFVCNHKDCLFKTSSIERFKAHLSRHKAGFGGKATSASMQSNPTTTPEFFKDLCDRIVPVACNLCPDLAFTDFRKLVEHDKAEHQIDSLVHVKPS